MGLVKALPGLVLLIIDKAEEKTSVKDKATSGAKHP